MHQLKLAPPLPQDLFPGVLMSGSSEAGLAAGKAINATSVTYPMPGGSHEGAIPISAAASGIRVGIIARKDESIAWEIAYARFPEERRGQLAHQLAMKTSDSVWHEQLSAKGEGIGSMEKPYWLAPFQNYKTFCPYLVGSYEQVAQELAKYIDLGNKTIILDIPPDEEELHHTDIVFEMAAKRLVSA